MGNPFNPYSLKMLQKIRQNCWFHITQVNPSSIETDCCCSGQILTIFTAEKSSQALKIYKQDSLSPTSLMMLVICHPVLTLSFKKPKVTTPVFPKMALLFQHHK